LLPRLLLPLLQFKDYETKLNVAEKSSCILNKS
jgi:hypothetical protein